MIVGPHGQQQFGNYRLIQRLGSGGFAEVYLGRHIFLETQAAIKVLKDQNDQKIFDDFQTEAKRVAALKHSHIISVHEFGIEHNMPYLVMDYAPRGTLRRRHPRQTSVPLPVVANYVQQIASALSHAHEQKIVHRDVKPENMLISANDDILLSDFGISITVHRTETMTPQDVSGTYTYIAPEQFDGKARPESDQYSLAVVIYEWLCGVPPFSGAPPALIQQHLYRIPSSLRQYRPDLPPAVDTSVLKALAKRPQQRFPTIMDFALAIEKATKTTTRSYRRLSPSLPAELAVSLSPQEVRVQDLSEKSGVSQRLQEPAVLPPMVSSLQSIHEDTDPSQASLAANVHTSSQSAGTSFNGFFLTSQEKIQLALVAEKRAAWKAQLPSQFVSMNIEQCYMQGLRERAQKKSEEAALWWLQGIALNPDYNHGIFIKLAKEDFQKLLPQHLVLLNDRLKKARLDGNLEREIQFLVDIQTLDPQNQEVNKQLLQAQQDKEHMWMCEQAYQFLSIGELLLAVEQLQMLQSHASTFRSLSPLREQVIQALADQIRQEMNNSAFFKAQPYLTRLREIAPQDSRLQTLQDQWCTGLYQQAAQLVESETPASALALVFAIAEIAPRHQGLFDLKRQIYSQMCGLVLRSIEDNLFEQAQQQLAEMEARFPQAERHEYESIDDNRFFHLMYTIPSDTREEIQQLSTSIEKLNVLLHLKQAEYIASQQRQLFLDGEMARQQGDYAETLRCWRELQQQNPTFVSSTGSFMRRLQDELFATILWWRKRSGLSGLIRRLWWEIQYQQNGGIELESHINMVLREYAEQAGECGNWQLACDLLREVLQCTPSSKPLQEHLAIAEQNTSVVAQYEQAKQCVAQEEIAQAIPLLQTVWTQAPYYGDPDQLALATNLYSPLSPGRYIKNGCTIWIAGSLAGLFSQSVFVCVLIALVSAALIIYPLYRKHCGRPFLHAMAAISGCIIAILLTLLFH